MHEEQAPVEMEPELDVAIVGYGPVGQALGGMLARAGHRVEAFERFNEIYRLPRAVHIDHEIMRLLQAIGLADRVAEEMEPLREYRWFGADGEELLTLVPEIPSKSGWEPDYLFFQPELERALDSACTRRRRHACTAAGSPRASPMGRRERR